MTLDPPRRPDRDAPQKGKVRDVDVSARVRNMKALGFALYGGLPIGAAAGYAVGHTFLGLLLGPVLIWTVATALTEIAARGAGRLHMPSGSSTPRRKGRSRAEALAVRGEYEAAIVAYQNAILDAPEDGEAYLSIARIYRDEVQNPEEALLWFRRGLTEAELSVGQEILTRREMAELLSHHLQEPRRAAPDLARLAETYPRTRAGEWAKEELARIKEEMAEED